MEKKKINEKAQHVASIPANYVSILQLQERWLKEKEQKHNERDLVQRRLKQEVDDEQWKRKQRDLVKLVKPMESSLKLEEENGFRKKKEPTFFEKEVSATVSKKERDGEYSKEEKKKKKKKWSKNQGGFVKKDVKCESNNQRVCMFNGENVARDSIAVETQFQELRIKKRNQVEERDFKSPVRLNDRNQRHGLRATGTMIWVKKNDVAANGNGV